MENIRANIVENSSITIAVNHPRFENFLENDNLWTRYGIRGADERA